MLHLDICCFHGKKQLREKHNIHQKIREKPNHYEEKIRKYKGIFVDNYCLNPVGRATFQRFNVIIITVQRTIFNNRLEVRL